MNHIPRLGCAYQKVSRWPVTPEEKAAPQHAKKVREWDNARLRKLAKGNELESVLDGQLRWNEDESLYESMDTQPVRHCVSNVKHEHLVQQEEIGLIRKCDKNLIKRFGKAMHTYEPATADRGHRLRPLLHPQDVNEWADFVGEMSLESTAEQMYGIDPDSEATAHDFTAGFWQGGLAEKVQYYYGFEDQTGQCWVYCRMVMGCKIAAKTMQVVSQILATARQAPADLAVVRTTVHIDNVRFTYLKANATSGAAMTRVFRENCEYVYATLNEEPTNAPHRIGPFCGVMYDYEHGLTWAMPKTLKKLDRALLAFESNTTLQHMMELFGLMFHLSTILRPPIATYYHILKWYRKRTAEFANGDTTANESARVWPSTLKQLEAWVEHLKANKPVGRPTASPDNTHLFTDASDAGWGAYLMLPSGVVLIAASSWTTLEASRNINEREAMAVDNALRAFAHHLTGASFHLHIDNTSVIWGLAKGRSHRWNMNKRVAEIMATLKRFNATCALHYVSTRDNPADDPSRYPERYTPGPSIYPTHPTAVGTNVSQWFQGGEEKQPYHFVRSSGGSDGLASLAVQSTLCR